MTRRSYPGPVGYLEGASHKSPQVHFRERYDAHISRTLVAVRSTGRIRGLACSESVVQRGLPLDNARKTNAGLWQEACSSAWSPITLKIMLAPLIPARRWQT